MNFAELERHIAEFDLERVREHLADAPAPADGRSAALLIDDTVNWVGEIRDELLSIVRGIGDSEDMPMTLAVKYIEFKSRWIGFNTKINYTMFNHGAPNAEDMCRGAAMSTLLGHIEPLLRPDDIDEITTFLSSPIADAA